MLRMRAIFNSSGTSVPHPQSMETTSSHVKLDASFRDYRPVEASDQCLTSPEDGPADSDYPEDGPDECACTEDGPAASDCPEDCPGKGACPECGPDESSCPDDGSAECDCPKMVPATSECSDNSRGECEKRPNQRECPADGLDETDRPTEGVTESDCPDVCPDDDGADQRESPDEGHCRRQCPARGPNLLRRLVDGLNQSLHPKGRPARCQNQRRRFSHTQTRRRRPGQGLGLTRSDDETDRTRLPEREMTRMTPEGATARLRRLDRRLIKTRPFSRMRAKTDTSLPILGPHHHLNVWTTRPARARLKLLVSNCLERECSNCLTLSSTYCTVDT